jgi:hypothetical protein
MTDTTITDEEFTSDLAMYWYFLDLQFDRAGSERSDELADELIKHGTQLKKLLQSGGYTEDNTLSVSVGEETCFQIWLDTGGDIRVGKLKRAGQTDN